MAPRARPAIASKYLTRADNANTAVEKTLTEALRGDPASQENAVDAAVVSLDELAVTTLSTARGASNLTPLRYRIPHACTNPLCPPKVNVMLGKPLDPELFSMERAVSGDGASALGGTELLELLLRLPEELLAPLQKAVSLDSETESEPEPEAESASHEGGWDNQCRHIIDPPLTLLRLSAHLEALHSPIHPSSAHAGVRQYNKLIRSVPMTHPIPEDETSWRQWIKDDQSNNRAVIYVVKAAHRQKVEIIQCLTLTVDSEETGATDIQLADVVTRRTDTWRGRRLRRRGLLTHVLGAAHSRPACSPACIALQPCSPRTYRPVTLTYVFKSRSSLPLCGSRDFGGRHDPPDVQAVARARVPSARVLALCGERAAAAAARAACPSARPGRVGQLRRGGAGAPRSRQRGALLRPHEQAVRRVRCVLDRRRRSARAAQELRGPLRPLRSEATRIEPKPTLALGAHLRQVAPSGWSIVLGAHRTLSHTPSHSARSRR